MLSVKRLQNLNICTLALLGLMLGAQGAQARDCADMSELEAQIDARLSPSDALDQPGFVVSITRADGCQAVVASGASDLEQARANSADTVFHLASLSKQITAAAIALAIEDGLVSLDDPLALHLPEAERIGSDLTLAHLMYMTSGLPEYTSLDRANGEPWATFHYFDVGEAIARVLETGELQFEPGAQWSYSNINFMLLAEVVERVYGMQFSELVRTRLFAPLGMQASLVHDDVTTLIPNRATGYTARTEEVVTTLNEQGAIHVAPGPGWVVLRRNAPHYGGSGVFSSARDWRLWQIEMMTHQRLGEEFWSLMTSTRAFDHSKVNDGFGLVVDDWEGRPVLWYSGGDIDTSTYGAVFPEAGYGVACFANDPFGGCEAKARIVIEALIEADRL